jgi:hypothetical protein
LRQEQPGGALPEPLLMTSFDTQRVSRTGIVVTVLLHVLVLLLAMLQRSEKDGVPVPRKTTDVTYIVARQRQPETPVKPAVKPQPAPVARPARPKPRLERVEIARLPDTITVPEAPRPAPEPVKPVEIPKVAPELDMAEMIAARKRKRQRDSGVEEQETDAQRGERRALENIAAANSAGKAGELGVDKSMFSKVIHSPFTATLEYRGVNAERRRVGMRQYEVELGGEPDIESAIIKAMIRVIRKEFGTENFVWITRHQRKLVVSPRPEDNAALEAVLFRDVFPEHQRAR